VVKYSGKNSRSGLRFIDAAADHPDQINTCSWPENAHHWFPCFDYPNDKVTHELIATIDSEYKVLSNGRLISVSEDRKNTRKTYHWFQEKPHPTCLIMMAAGPYEVIKDSIGSLPVNYWVYKKDVTDAKRIFKKTPLIIDFFNKTFGYEYPWAKYDQVCVASFGGGIENTSATALGHGVICDAATERDYPVIDLIAHELAHQWWGDLVTERTWSHVWLSESFATYSQYLFLCFDMGQDEGAVELLEKKNSYLSEAKNRYIRPLVFNRYEKPWNILDAHSYPKGAVILHMLRFVLGDKPFFRSLSYFLHKHAFQVVDSHDFAVAIKDACGQNVDWFFDQWVYKPGHPVFDVKYDWQKDKKKLKLTIRQTQDTSKGIPIYKLPVIIGVITPGRKYSEKLWLTKKEDVFELDVEQEPLLVRFDEGNYLLKEWTFEKNLTELLYQLGNDDVIGRMWAASEIAKFPDNPKALAALLKSAETAPCRHVRKAAVESLGKLKKPDLIPFLKSRCGAPESKIRAAALKALGNYERPELAPFFMQQYKQENSVFAQVATLIAISKCGNKSHIPFLEEVVKTDSLRDNVKRIAKYAVKKIKSRQSEKIAKKEER